MKLSEYINLHKNKSEARETLAQAIGCEEVTVRSWANGNRFPHRKWWKSIELATKGKVTIADMVE